MCAVLSDMSRHRNVRALNAEEEFEGYDDVYGHSYDDAEYGVSPGTAKQFLFNRDKSNVTFASVMDGKESIEEEPDNLEAVRKIAYFFPYLRTP